MHFPI